MSTELVSLATEINAEHEAACRAAQSTIEHVRRAGELLIEAKDRQGHGNWLGWLAAHCPTISERTAQAYMQVARHWPELEAKAPRAADLPLRGALLLLAEPTAASEPAGAEAGHQENPWRKWIAMRDLLVQVRDQKLYLEACDTFEEFLKAFDKFRVVDGVVECCFSDGHKDRNASDLAASLDNLGARWKADMLAQVWDLAPGIELTLTGIVPDSVPANLPLENWKKILSLFSALDPGLERTRYK